MNYLIFLHVMALPGGTARVVKVGHTTKGFGVEVLILVASAASDSVPSPIRGVCCISRLLSLWVRASHPATPIAIVRTRKAAGFNQATRDKDRAENAEKQMPAPHTAGPLPVSWGRG